MIIETILNVLVSLLLGVVSLFPAIPEIQFDFLDGVIQVFSLIDGFVSLRVLSSCFIVILMLNNAHLVWSVVMWAVKKLPFVN